jgi:hypothetical protein
MTRESTVERSRPASSPPRQRKAGTGAPKPAERVPRGRKVRVVAAVRSGILGVHEALQRYGLSLEEFLGWERETAAEIMRRRESGRMRELTRFRRRSGGRGH